LWHMRVRSEKALRQWRTHCMCGVRFTTLASRSGTSTFSTKRVTMIGGWPATKIVQLDCSKASTGGWWLPPPIRPTPIASPILTCLNHAARLVGRVSVHRPQLAVATELACPPPR